MPSARTTATPLPELLGHLPHAIFSRKIRGLRKEIRMEQETSVDPTSGEMRRLSSALLGEIWSWKARAVSGSRKD